MQFGSFKTNHCNFIQKVKRRANKVCKSDKTDQSEAVSQKSQTSASLQPLEEEEENEDQSSPQCTSQLSDELILSPGNGCILLLPVSARLLLCCLQKATVGLGQETGTGNTRFSTDHKKSARRLKCGKKFDQPCLTSFFFTLKLIL